MSYRSPLDPASDSLPSARSLHQTYAQWLAFLALVAIGAGLRVILVDLPNFAPVAAIALFAGYWFRSQLLALALPLAIMTSSDLVLGGYDWKMMILVYGSLAAPALLRPLLHRYLQVPQAGLSQVARPLAGLFGCSLACSVAFFLVTNFGTWLWSPMYSHTPAGLVQCYVQALPFFRYTLLGDLSFGALLFGSYALARVVAYQREQAKLGLGA